MSKRNPVLTAFGSNVRKRRELKELTQEGLAEKSDLDQTYISGVERGVRNPSVLVIVRLAKALGISVSELSKGGLRSEKSSIQPNTAKSQQALRRSCPVSSKRRASTRSTSLH